MNGGHDLGGMHGLGPIDPEPETAEPVFHAQWEQRVFALTLAAAALGRWTIDMGRHARERQHPADYLRHSYYENWLAGLETLVVERGLVSAAELASGTAAGAADPALAARVLSAERVGPAMARGGPVDVALEAPPRFAIGDRVRALNRHPRGHTREPRYVRGRAGVICTHYGGHVFPDLSAEGRREGHHLYSVRFEAQELWGESAAPKAAVYVDLWEDHLEPAG
jgi:nitrile hydratase beta subunit